MPTLISKLIRLLSEGKFPGACAGLLVTCGTFHNCFSYWLPLKLFLEMVAIFRTVTHPALFPPTPSEVAAPSFS